MTEMVTRNLFFLADFLLRWYAAESRIKFLIQPYVVGEITWFQLLVQHQT
jgi:hypothetical protein